MAENQLISQIKCLHFPHIQYGGLREINVKATTYNQMDINIFHNKWSIFKKEHSTKYILLDVPIWLKVDMRDSIDRSLPNRQRKMH